jgi:PKD repeat protein
MISFHDLTTEAPIARWIWDFGDGSSETLDAPLNPDIKHVYLYPGMYEVTLITQSTAGCGDTITNSIRRTPCISAQFAVVDTAICQKRTMRFTESSTCQAPISSWTWFFGDNTYVTFTTPPAYVEHAYSVAGNYTVKMLVATQMVGGLVTDTATRQIVVKPAAIAAYQWQDVCIGSTTIFTNLSLPNNTKIKSYSWNFGDSGSTTDTSSAKHPEYAYNHFGEYTVKLVTTNTLGCTDTTQNLVNIFENPAADFNWNSSCEARPVYFIDASDSTSSAVVKWNWVFRNAGELLGASLASLCSYSFGHAGIYDAELKITDRNGCSDSIQKQVAINSSPVAKFEIIENYEDKQGEILLNNLTTNGLNYAWDFGNGTTSTGMNPVATYTAAGHYEIRLITWNGQNCTDTAVMNYELMYKSLFVPTAFSPADMNPEVAVFQPKGINLKSYLVQVYDRGGNMVWTSHKLDNYGSPTESWDGTVHGKDLPQGAYLWKISAQFRDGEFWNGYSAGKTDDMPQSKTGTVTIIR